MRVLRNLILTSLTFGLLLTSAGCNFFGKQVDSPPAVSLGQLPGGASILGTWIMDSAGTSATNNPSVALTTSYTFDPNGGFRITLRDLHSGGLQCTAYGQYKSLTNSDIVLYVQSVGGASCGFSSIMHFSQIQVLGQGLALKFKDMTGGEPGVDTILVAARGQENAPIGLWNFSGQGGIDYMMLDPYGYFVIQSTDQGQSFLLFGDYELTSDGQFVLNFYMGLDPTQPGGLRLVFLSYLTDGVHLQLNDKDQTGQDIFYVGTKL